MSKESNWQIVRNMQTQVRQNSERISAINDTLTMLTHGQNEIKHLLSSSSTTSSGFDMESIKAMRREMFKFTVEDALVQRMLMPGTKVSAGF